MHFRLRALRVEPIFVARMILAATLALALVSRIAPLDSVSSAHLCTMACCAGLPPHLAGSCNMSLSGGKKRKVEPEKLCGMSEAPASQDDAMRAMHLHDSLVEDVTVDASDHCSMDAHSGDVHLSSRNDSTQPLSVAAQAWSRPCPPECSSGAVSFAQVRPSRDSAALAYAVRPRPPARGRRLRYSHGAPFIPTAYRKQSRPRGPPLSFSALHQNNTI